jgi:hypothetical protein
MVELNIHHVSSCAKMPRSWKCDPDLFPCSQKENLASELHCNT